MTIEVDIMNMILKYKKCECKAFLRRLTAEVKVGGDNEEIREDDGEGDHEDKARLHESLQRGLLHAATLSSCIPPPALRCFYPSPSSRSSCYQVLDASRSSYWSTFRSCTCLLRYVLSVSALLEINIEVLRQKSSRYWNCVFKDLDILLM